MGVLLLCTLAWHSKAQLVKVPFPFPLPLLAVLQGWDANTLGIVQEPTWADLVVADETWCSHITRCRAACPKTWAGFSKVPCSTRSLHFPRTKLPYPEIPLLNLAVALCPTPPTPLPHRKLTSLSTFFVNDAEPPLCRCAGVDRSYVLWRDR